MTRDEVIRVLDLVHDLSGFYSPGEIQEWLRSPHPQLEGKIAVDVIADGQIYKVRAIVRRLESDGYL